MAAYATQTDFEGYVEGWVTDNADALERLLERATRDVDNVLGPLTVLTVGDFAGYKLDPGALAEWEAEALSRAVCAQAEWRFRRGDEALAVGRAVKRVKGPDFEEEYAPAGGPVNAGSTGRYSPQVRRELEPIRHLRGLTATVDAR